ncbi:MAG: hypothetical protein FJ102_22845 [Deltaproteobacteria bacterium]|nr:hypothetical protein [Deltaproteobacteria bacterium]
MTLGQDLDTRLKNGIVSAENGGRVVEADVDDADRLGVTLGRLRVTTPGGELDRAVEVIPVATSRALGDRIVPVEVDAGLGGAVFRSAPEEIRDREFYEVRTTGSETTVERFRNEEEGRVKVPFILTRKALGRLVDEIAGE